MTKQDKTLELMIDIFLCSTRQNKEGVRYNLFDSDHRKADLLYLKDFFMNVYYGLSQGLSKEEKKEVLGQMLLTFDRIESIRIDETDEKLRPMEFLVSDMKNTHKGQLDLNGGVTRAIFEHGITMLIPALKSEIVFNLKNKKDQSIKGTHVGLHEMVHAMSVWVDVLFEKKGLFKKQPRYQYVQGVRPNNMAKGIFDDFNEGLVEYITRSALNAIFSGSKYKAKIEEHYPTRVKLVEEVLNLFGDEKQKITLMYITGRGKEILEKFHKIKNSKGQSLYDFFVTNYQNQRRGISGCEDKNFPLFAQDEAVLEEIKLFLKDCTYEKDEEHEIAD